MPRALLILMLLAMFYWPALAAAQDAGDTIELDEDSIASEDMDGADEGALADDEDGVIDLGSAEVLGSRSLESLLGDTRAITVIDAAAFGGATSVGDVLERVEGIDVRSTGGFGQLSTVMLRGARSEQVLVLMDGAPLALEPADLSLLPLGTLERVEVVRGAAAARFGAGALGGVVNLVTRRPPEADRDGSDTDQEYVPLGERDFSELFDRSAGGTTLIELMITAGGERALDTALQVATPDASYYLAHLQARNNYSYERAGGLSATRRNNDVSQQSFWASWRARGTDYRGGLTHLDRGVPGGAEFPTLEARIQRDNLWWQASAAGWRADIGVQQSHFTDPAPFLNRGAIDTRNTRAHLELALGSLADQRGSWGFKPRFDYLTSDDYGDHARAGLDLHGYRAQTSGRLTLTLDGGLVATEDVAVDPVARLGANYRLDSAAEAFSAVGYAVRHPSFNELYYPDTGGVRGNPKLDSERLVSYELGLRWTGPRARLELAGFYSDYRDSIIWAPVSAYTVEAINSGPAEVLGVEALADVQLAPALWWRTAGSWLPRAEYDSGVPLTGRSEYHANSRLEYSDKHWRTALSLDCTGEIPADLFGSLVIEPRALVGLELARGLNSGELGLTINNVFDEQARDSWNYPLPGREIYLTWRTEL